VPAPGSSLAAILLSKKAEAIAALAAKQAVTPLTSPTMVSALDRLAKYKRREQKVSAALAAAAAAPASDGSAPSSPAPGAGSGAGSGAGDPHTAAVQAALASLLPAELLSESAHMSGNVAVLSALFDKRLSEASEEALAALQDMGAPSLELPPYLADLLAARLAEMPTMLCNPQSRAAAPAGLPASASASDAFTAATAAAQDATASLVAAGTDALSTMPQSLTAALGGTLDMASLERMVSGAAPPVPGAGAQPAAAAAAAEVAAPPVAVARSPTPGGDGNGAPSIPLGGTQRGRVLVWPSSADGPEALLSDDGDEMSSISTMLTLRLAAAGPVTVCTGNSEGTLQLWSARGSDHRSWARGRCLGHPAAHFGSVDALAEVEHPGEGGRGLVLSGGADGTVRLWCPLSGAGASAPLRHDGGTTVGAGLGPGACVTGGQDGHLRFWHLAVLAAPPESPTPSSPLLNVQLTQRLAVKGSAPITAVVGLPGGRCATGEALPRDRGGCHVTLWSSAGERERCVLIPAHATCMCLLPLTSPLNPGAAPQPRLAVGTADGTICILLAEERVQEQQSSIPLAARQVAAPAVTVKAHPVRLTALACGSGIQPSSGATLASVAADGSAAMWAVATGRSPAMAKRRALAPPLGSGSLTAVTVL
jgi:WD40 repeat protein